MLGILVCLRRLVVLCSSLLLICRLVGLGLYDSVFWCLLVCGVFDLVVGMDMADFGGWRFMCIRVCVDVACLACVGFDFCLSG